MMNINRLVLLLAGLLAIVMALVACGVGVESGDARPAAAAPAMQESPGLQGPRGLPGAPGFPGNFGGLQCAGTVCASSAGRPTCVGSRDSSVVEAAAARCSRGGSDCGTRGG